MMKILALDMATETGWAMNIPEVSGVANFSVSRGESPGMRFIRFTTWLNRMIDRVKPDMIIYEQAHHRGGAATEVAVGLVTHLQSVCAKRGINFTKCHTSKIKKKATGKGNAGKDLVMKAYRDKWGRDPVDDNECDARWLLEWAKEEFC